MSNENDRKVLQAILNPETPFQEETPVEKKNRKTTNYHQSAWSILSTSFFIVYDLKDKQITEAQELEVQGKI